MLMCGDIGKLQQKLLDAGFFAALEVDGYASFCVTEKHGKDELDALVAAVKEVTL